MTHDLRRRTAQAGGVLALGAIVLALLLLPASTGQAQTGGLIGYGTSVAGEVSATLPLVTYAFTGAGGDTVMLDAIPLMSGLQPALQLLDPAGQTLATSTHHRSSAHPQNAHIAAILPGDGTYTVHVSGQNGTTGQYVLRLQGRAATPPTALVYGEPLAVTLSPNTPPQFFAFDAQDCPTTLTITDDTPGEPFTFPFAARLRNATGREIARLAGGDAQEDRVTVAALSGRYGLELSPADPQAEGQITLAVTCAADAPGCAALGGTPGFCPACPSCAEDLDEGLVPACPVMAFTAERLAEGALLTWNGVPDAEFYWIHLYGRNADEERYLGAVGVPGGAEEYVLDHLFGGFWGFRLVLEAIAGGEPICTDETLLTREPDRVEVCPPLNLSGRVTDNVGRWAEWTWDPAPDIDGYYAELAAVLADGTLQILGEASWGPELTAWDTWHPADIAPTNRFQVTLYSIVGGHIVCPETATIQFEVPTMELVECALFTATAEQNDPGPVTFSWTAYPDAEQYWFYIMQDDGTMLDGFPVMLPPDQLSLVYPLPPGTFAWGVGPWTAAGGVECLEGGRFTTPGTFDALCRVITDAADVPIYVGPGRHRSVFAFMTPGLEYGVLGQFEDTAGQIWWQIDKTLVPGHEMVLSLWVAAEDVTELGECGQVPSEEPPPLIPDESEGGPSEGWGPCGSCDTCGHPGECVTSPTGECLWDPTTCAGQVPGEGPPDGQQPTCVFVTGAVSPPGTGSAGPITQGNCISEIAGIYRPGTVVQAQAFPNPGCWLNGWTGCGASGNANPVTFTANTSCTITALIGCVQ